MAEVNQPEDWTGLSPWPAQPWVSARIRTIQSKFFDLIRSAAESSHVELVMVWESPSKGYAYIQTKTTFSSLYGFHFQFTNSAAILSFEGTQDGSKSPQRREVNFADGPAMDSLLADVINGIQEASKSAFPKLEALSTTAKAESQFEGQAQPAPVTPQYMPPPQPRPATETTASARVWGQTREGTRSSSEVGTYHPPRNWGRIITIVVLVVLFLVFVPVIAAQNPATCAWASCQGTTSYQSVISHSTGLGGEYMPSSWGSHYFVGSLKLSGGSSATGFGLGNYYFCA